MAEVIIIHKSWYICQNKSVWDTSEEKATGLYYSQALYFIFSHFQFNPICLCLGELFCMSVFAVLRKKGTAKQPGILQCFSTYTVFNWHRGRFEKSDIIKCTVYNRLIKIPLCWRFYLTSRVLTSLQLIWKCQGPLLKLDDNHKLWFHIEKARFCLDLTFYEKLFGLNTSGIWRPKLSNLLLIFG